MTIISRNRPPFGEAGSAIVYAGETVTAGFRLQQPDGSGGWEAQSYTGRTFGLRVYGDGGATLLNVAGTLVNHADGDYIACVLPGTSTDDLSPGAMGWEFAEFVADGRMVISGGSFKLALGSSAAPPSGSGAGTSGLTVYTLRTDLGITEILYQGAPGGLGDVATNTITGRAADGVGPVSQLTAIPFAFTGDVTRPADSNVQTIADDAVTYAKMQNVSASDRILGRSTAGAGNVEEIVCTAAGRALLDDADATAQRATLGLVIGTNVQAYDADLATWAGVTPGAGVATFISTPSSANLAAAVTDETGSGALVFANSPALITPALGAASATSLGLAAGTVSAPSLFATGDANTGLFFPAADTLALTTGGVDRLRVDSTGGVGIGIAPSASYGLSVGANVFFASGVLDLGASGHRVSYTGANLTISNGTTGTVAVQTGGASRLTIDNAGNVGIGTTSPASYTGYTTLAINHGTNGGVLDFLIAGTRHLTMYSGPSTSSLGTVSATHLAFTTGNTERMRLTATGNFGIGVTSPSTRLEVSGNIRTTPGSAGIITLFDNDAVRMNQLIVGADANGSYIHSTFVTGGSSDLRFITSNTERMRIVGGFVGIGTNAPGAPLDIRGSSGLGFRLIETTTGNSNRIQLGTGSGFGYVDATVGTGTTALVLQVASTERVRINQDGNVGIGTNDPTAGRLNVVGDQIVVSGSSGLGALGLQIKGAALSAIPAAQIHGYIATGDSSAGVAGDLLIAPRTTVTASVRFITGTTPAERLRIDAAGNVGVGTTSPGARLHVSAGNIRLTASSDGSNGVLQIQDTAVSTLLQIYNDSTKANIAVVESKPMLFYTTNLERMRLDAGGNMGLGISVPLARLDVNGNIRTSAGSGGMLSLYDNDPVRNNRLNAGADASGAYLDTTFSSGGTAALLFRTTGTEHARINQAGNLAVGDTATLYDGLTSKVSVLSAKSGNTAGQMVLVDSASQTTGVGGSIGLVGRFNVAGSYALGARIAAQKTNSTADDYGFDLAFWTRPNAGALAQRMVIGSTGNVAIGTTNPASHKLIVVGGNTSTLRLDNAGEQYTSADWFNNGSNRASLYYDATAAQFIVRTLIAADIGFDTNLTRKMTILSGGDVGIGTAAPGSKLDVRGQIRFTEGGVYSAAAINSGVLNYDSVNGDLVLAARSSGGNTAVSIRTSNGGTDSEKLRVLANGNVGIGTASPSIALQVESSTNGSNGFFVRNTNAGSSAACIVSVNSDSAAVTLAAHSAASSAWPDAATLSSGPTASGGLQIITATTAPIGFWTNSVERMRIDASGNIGIRTTNQFGSGAGVIGLANAATAPTTDPTAGGVLFAEAGALKWRGSSGTITTIANA